LRLAGRARLFLATWLLLHLDDREGEGVLADELAHILRRDHRMAWPAVPVTPMGCGSLLRVIGL
jgi:Zn-dependent protease with chaperone function